MDSFSCIPFLRQFHLSLNLCYFINLTLKYLHLRPVQPLSMTLMSKRLAENDVRTSKRHSDVMHESHLTPAPHMVRQHFLAPVRDTELPVGCVRKYLLDFVYKIFIHDNAVFPSNYDPLLRLTLAWVNFRLSCRNTVQNQDISSCMLWLHLFHFH